MDEISFHYTNSYVYEKLYSRSYKIIKQYILDSTLDT